MYAIRLVLIAVAVGAVVLIARQLLRREAPPRKAPLEAPHRMVRCAHCGVHVPEEEALFRAGTPYCSEQHRIAHSDS
ncbi:MAG: hypothetical protein GWO02_18280 [Gammaproteobacteria bacterium]|nr:hypothetical protein [Gammaproteobacteria bacterium]